MVPDEDGRLQQRERAQLHDLLARRAGLQRDHPQAQTGPDTVRETAPQQPHPEPE